MPSLCCVVTDVDCDPVLPLDVAEFATNCVNEFVSESPMDDNELYVVPFEALNAVTMFTSWFLIDSTSEFPHRTPPGTAVVAVVPIDEPLCPVAITGAAVALLISAIAALYAETNAETALTRGVVSCATVTLNGCALVLCRVSATPGIAVVTVLLLL